MKTFIRILLIGLSFTPASKAFGIVISFGENELDLAPKVGLAFCTISSNENKSAGKQDFGGVSLGLSFGFDHTQTWSTFVTPEALVDLNSMSVLRKGAQAGLLYHLMGGAKRTQKHLSNATITHRYSHSVALMMKSSYFEYTVRDVKELVQTTKGSIIENSIGIDGRLDLDEINSYGTQLSLTFLTLPTGSEGLATSSQELSFYWRRYF